MIVVRARAEQGTMKAITFGKVIKSTSVTKRAL